MVVLRLGIEIGLRHHWISVLKHIPRDLEGQHESAAEKKEKRKYRKSSNRLLSHVTSARQVTHRQGVRIGPISKKQVR